MKTNKTFLLSSLFVSMFASTSVLADSTESEIEALKTRLAELEKKVEKKSAKVKNTGAGLRIKDKKTGTSFKLNGRFHLDYDNFDGAYNAKNDGDNSNDLFIRRARVGISGDLNQDWAYQFVLAFGGGNRKGKNREDGRIQNAILSYNGFKRNGGPQIQIGKIKEDVTLEAVTSSNHITAMSRSAIVNAVSPFFNWGLRVNQNFKDSGLRYAVGIYQAADGASNGRKEGDGNNLWAVTGRVNYAPIATKDTVIHVGAWGSIREHGDAELRNRARGEIRNTNVRLLDSNAGGKGVAVSKINEYGLEFAAVNGPFSVQSEYIMRDADTTNSADSAPELSGYYVTGSYFITGESRYYDQAKGAFKQPKGVKNAWEVYARLTNADSTFKNAALDNKSQGTEIDVMTLGVNYYLNSQLRFMLNYQDAKVKGSEAAVTSLVGTQDKGKGFTARVQYTF
ncbi:OprO/OprP family phosphate-selective porin [Parashewanella tropica]|uniref:OprO/OprP family phosphate-selective porin n=1 Tax=Parashewanella tropica TaxID=2547970 RepID=UPI0014784F26|nr:porin [Parashewanella tropica]